jgi:hypothetical protein
MKEFISTSKLMAMAGCSYGQIRAAATSAGVEPGLVLDDCAYYSAADLRKIQQALAAANNNPQPTPSAGTGRQEDEDDVETF